MTLFASISFHYLALHVHIGQRVGISPVALAHVAATPHHRPWLEQRSHASHLAVLIDVAGVVVLRHSIVGPHVQRRLLARNHETRDLRSNQIHKINVNVKFQCSYLVAKHVDVEAVVVFALEVDDDMVDAVRVGAAVEDARVLVTIHELSEPHAHAERAVEVDAGGQREVL